MREIVDGKSGFDGSKNRSQKVDSDRKKIEMQTEVRGKEKNKGNGCSEGGLNDSKEAEKWIKQERKKRKKRGGSTREKGNEGNS